MSDIITILGDSLSSLINKPSLSCKGLIRFALRDAGLNEKVAKNELNLDDLHKSIENELKLKLIKIKVDNPDSVVQNLVSVLKRNQAILIMNV